MYITANRQELLSVARDAERIAPANSPMDVMKCTYLATENGKLTVAAGNLEVAMERCIPVQIHEEGSVVIGADLLTAMLKLLEGDSVSIRQESPGIISVTSGRATYSISALNADSYLRMEIPFPEDTVPVNGIPALAKRTCFAVSREENKPEMRCVHLVFSNNGLRAVGSDGYRIASAKGDSKAIGDVDMLIPATSLEKLAQLVSNKDIFKVGTTGKTVVFMKEDFTFSARLMEGQYFDADQLLSRAAPSFTILMDAEQMKQTLSAVYSVTGMQNRFSLTFEGKKLYMRFESEFGVSSIEMDVVPLSGTPAGEYWYNPAKLMECLRAQNGTLILELAQNGTLIMRTDELVCMQLAIREPKPVELKSKEAKCKEEKPKEKKTNNAKGKATPKTEKRKEKKDTDFPKAA